MASTQNIIYNQWPHIILNWSPTVECSPVLIHLEANLFCPRKKHNVTRPNWALQMVTQASPRLILGIFLIIMIIIRCSGMFRDVPGCSGMFRDVPCSWFYRRPFLTGLIILMQNEVDKPTRLLRFVALVHLPFSFRSLDLFVASLLFMKVTSYCVVRRKKSR